MLLPCPSRVLGEMWEVRLERWQCLGEMGAASVWCRTGSEEEEDALSEKGIEASWSLLLISEGKIWYLR